MATPPRCWRPRSSISASTPCARPRRTWRRPACRCGSILRALPAALRPGERLLQPVVAPEQLAGRGGEAWCTENAKHLRRFDLGPQAKLDVVRLRRFERGLRIDIHEGQDFGKGVGLIDPAVLDKLRRRDVDA